MSQSGMTRRVFAAMLSSPALAPAAEGWESLFDGKSLSGWTASENKGSWKIIEGALAADGARSHLFYSGSVNGADFRNFELEVEAMATPGANSGVYFHTVYQEQGFPRKGFEVQINNTATGEGRYRERKKTGSLYGLRNVYKQIAADQQWFTIRALVRGKNIQVHVNGMLVVDYTEPTPPYIPQGLEPERFLDHGTFALQCHDPGSKVRYRAIRVRPLPDNATAPGIGAPVVDQTFRDIIELGRANIPLIDFDVQLKGGLTVQNILTQSRSDGFQRGIAGAAGKGLPIHDDRTARRFADSLKAHPVFAGLRPADRNWTQTFSRETLSLFDYVIADPRTWSEKRVAGNPQEFIDAMVDRTARILESEPIDICASVTALPAPLDKVRLHLWTEERLKKILSALARNGVAMQISERDRLPSADVIRMAQHMGVKFTFGSGHEGGRRLGRCEYGIAMAKECKLSWTDFWVPGGWGPKAVERKSEALAR